MQPRLAAIALFLWAVLLALSLTLTILAADHDTLPGDTGIATWAQDLAFPGQTLSDVVRAITSTEVVLAAGGLLAVALWLRGFRRLAVIFAIGLVVLPVMQAGIKEIVDRARPTTDVVEIRGSLGSPSFPSGHVMSSTYLYGFLIYAAIALPLATPLRVAIASLSLAVFALSGPVSVWLGVHWSSDVLGGYAWGLIVLGPIVLADRILSDR